MHDTNLLFYGHESDCLLHRSERYTKLLKLQVYQKAANTLKACPLIRAALRQPEKPCLGFRPFDPVTKKFGAYQWLDYGTVQRRRAAFGAGLVELHERIGIAGQNYGVGLWCQNRPEWQLTGKKSYPDTT